MAGFRVSYDTLYESASPRERGEIVYSRAHAVLEGPLQKRQRNLFNKPSFAPVWVVVDRSRHLSSYAGGKRPQNGDIPRKRMPLSEIALIQHFDGMLELTVNCSGSSTPYALALTAKGNDETQGRSPDARGSTITQKLDEWAELLRNPDGMAHSCGTPYFEGVTPAGPAPTPEKTEGADAEHAAAADERTKDEQSETLDKVTEFESDSDEVHALAQQAAAE